MKQERIDNYVMGKMSAEERISFEQEIANDVDLQAEVALHRDVVRAIRMKAAKEHLQKVERQIRAEELSKKLKVIFGGASGGIGVIGATIYALVQRAACILVAASMQLSMPALMIRGDNPALDAYDMIEAREYKPAIELIDSVLSEKIDAKSQEELQYEEEVYEDLEWYKAVTYMHMGKWVKARKLLKRIAASGSIHKAEAQKVLEEL